MDGTIYARALSSKCLEMRLAVPNRRRTIVKHIGKQRFQPIGLEQAFFQRIDYDVFQPLIADACALTRCLAPILHPQNGFHPEHSRTFWSAVANALYIVRQDGHDRFGRTPNFAAKLEACPDLVAHGRRGPISADEDSLVGLNLWRAADEAAQHDRPNAPVAWHVVGWLPPEQDAERWRELVCTFLDTQIVQRGMIVDWAIHALADEHGGWIKRPHFHAVITARFWKGSRIGQPQAAWLHTNSQRSSALERWEKLAGGELRDWTAFAQTA